MIQAVHRFILLQADITCIGLLDLGIYRFEQRFQYFRYFHFFEC